MRGRWESDAGVGELAHVDVKEAPAKGSTIIVLLPGEPEQAWDCTVHGEQLSLTGDCTTVVVRARARVPGGAT